MQKINRSIFILTSLLFWPFILWSQIPDPKDICCHAQNTFKNSRTANIEYEHYDQYDVNFYFLNINAETTDTQIGGGLTMKGTVLSPEMDTIYLELSNNLEVLSIMVNEQNTSFIHKNDQIQIICASPLTQSEVFKVEIKYEGKAIAQSGRGYNQKSTNHGTNVSWTLSEPFYSKDWWPCKQDLLDKADSVWVFVTTSKQNKVGSNGILEETVQLENDKVRYQWKSKYPIAYYLISIAVAEYMEYSFAIPNESGPSVFMQNYLYPDSVMFKTQKAYIDCTYYQMDLLQEKYGTYPFIDEKYGHCITPISGGMEHQTMTTQRDFQFHLTIHEMGHSWFGNQVTCSSWNHIWINEGFATYTQYLGLEYLVSQAEADGFMASVHSRVMKEVDGSVFVPDAYLDDRDRIFSGRLSYYKGAAIIQMIRYLVNDDDLFFNVLRQFQQKYKNKTASAEDFKSVLEEHTQMSFEEFFDLWYYGEGFPIYDFEWKQLINGELVIRAIQQTSTPKTEFFPMKYDLLLYFKDGSEELIHINQDAAEKQIIIESNKELLGIKPNPRSQNLMKTLSVHQEFLSPNEVKIEPNPVTDKCMIRFWNTQPGRFLEVYNTEQKLIYKVKAEGLNQHVDLSEWAVGIYFIYVENGSQSQLLKVVKI